MVALIVGDTEDNGQHRLRLANEDGSTYVVKSIEIALDDLAAAIVPVLNSVVDRVKRIVEGEGSLGPNGVTSDLCCNTVFEDGRAASMSLHFTGRAEASPVGAGGVAVSLVQILMPVPLDQTVKVGRVIFPSISESWTAATVLEVVREGYARVYRGLA